MDFSPFWCCLPTREKSILSLMGLFVPDPDPEMLKAGYDAVWFANFGSVDDDWYNLWLDLFGMYITTKEVEPGLFEDVVVWPLGNWLAWGLFSLTPEFTCPDPCWLTPTYSIAPP